MKTCIIPVIIGLSFASIGCDRKTEVSTPSGTATVETASPTKQQAIGNWNQVKGKLKQKYANLTEDDLLYTEGKEEELYGRLQEKTGESRANVEKMVRDMRAE